MILVVDIGNTNITLGAYDKNDVVARFRLTTKTPRTSDEYGLIILSMLKSKGVHKEDICDVVVSSVVPNIMYSFNSGIIKYLDKTPIEINSTTQSEIIVKTDAPKQVGADRVVDLAGAYITYGGPAIVVDFGTATTFDILTKDREFIAGVTSPGIKISANALSSLTAKLPEIIIEKPESILAKNTITSMQAGLVYGYIGQVEYIIKRIKAEMDMDMKVIATGGLGRLITEETDTIDVYDRDLTFKGLKYIYDMNYKR